MARTDVKVEIDVFSGVPNPSRTINLDLLLRHFQSLCKVDCSIVSVPPLGYRGVLVHLSQEDGGTTRVFEGKVSSDLGCRLDTKRSFETWLLEFVLESGDYPSLKELFCSEVQNLLLRPNQSTKPIGESGGL